MINKKSLTVLIKDEQYKNKVNVNQYKNKMSKGCYIMDFFYQSYIMDSKLALNNFSMCI